MNVTAFDVRLLRRGADGERDGQCGERAPEPDGAETKAHRVPPAYSIIPRFCRSGSPLPLLALLWCKPLKHWDAGSQRSKSRRFSTEFSTVSVEKRRARSGNLT